jgi:hypothetical protein
VITAERQKEQGMLRQLRGSAIAMEALIGQREEVDDKE